MNCDLHVSLTVAETSATIFLALFDKRKIPCFYHVTLEMRFAICKIPRPCLFSTAKPPNKTLFAVGNMHFFP